MARSRVCYIRHQTDYDLQDIVNDTEHLFGDIQVLFLDDLAAGGTCFKLPQHPELTCFGVIHASLRAHIYRLHVYMRRQ